MAHLFHSGLFYQTGAWHGLGQVTQELLPTQEFFRQAGALFPVREASVDARITQPDGTVIRVPLDDHKAVVNGDNNKVLAVHSKDYTIIQNSALCDLANAFREEIELSAVCVLKEGRLVTFSAKIKSIAGEAVKNDPLDCYLNGSTSHDGSSALSLGFSGIRVVCNNTFTLHNYLAENSGRNTLLRVPHRSTADAILRRVPQVVDLANRCFTATLEELEAMAAKPCDAELYRRILEMTFEDELRIPVNDVRGDKSTERPRTLKDIRGIDKMQQHFREDLIGGNIPGVMGTVYAAYNSITQFYRHDFGKSVSSRYYSLNHGVNNDRLQRAKSACLAATTL